MSSRFLDVLKRATVSQKSSTPFARRSPSGSVASKSQNASTPSLAQTSLRSNAASPVAGSKLSESISNTYNQTKSTISNRVATLQRVGYESLSSFQFCAPSTSHTQSSSNLPFDKSYLPEYRENYWMTLVSGLFSGLGYYLLDDGTSFATILLLPPDLIPPTYQERTRHILPSLVVVARTNRLRGFGDRFSSALSAGYV